MKPVIIDLFWSFIAFAAACIFCSVAFGCSRNPALPPGAVTYNAHGRRLVIVAPSAWKQNLTGYVEGKREQGFAVSTLDAESEQTTLAVDLAKANPDFVFLVGDQTLIPTVYRCTDISSWSTAYARSCTYSDSWLSGAIVGRLLTHDVGDVDSYALKASAYHAFTPSKRAYLVGDRVYEPNDFGLLDFSRRLGYAGVNAKLDVVNLATDPFIRDGAGEADAETVTAAVDQAVDLITYYGHGAASAWGYYGNINRLGIVPAPGAVMPLVFAMACETARAAPNPPWYPYVDVNGLYEVITPGPPLVTADMIPDPAPIQPPFLVNNTLASRFTSELPDGAMVYIGETVVTGAEGALLAAFADGVAGAYKTPTTIGDIWASAAPHGTPDIWQIVGDPSTWFLVAEDASLR